MTALALVSFTDGRLLPPRSMWSPFSYCSGYRLPCPFPAPRNISFIYLNYTDQLSFTLRLEVGSFPHD